MLAERFKSASARFAHVRAVRQEWAAFFQDVTFDPNSPFLDFQFGSSTKISAGSTLTEIYHQPRTHTFVHCLTAASGRNIILKTFQVPAPSADTKLREHDVEVRFLRLFTELVRTAVTPHISLPMGRTVVTETAVRALLGATVPAAAYQVLVAEAADTCLTELISRRKLTPYQLKCLLFQAIYTLHCLQVVFPSFRHNDFHTSNILVQQVGTGLDYSCRYAVADKRYFVDMKRCPLRALLWDFYFSSILAADAKRAGLRFVGRQKEHQTSQTVPNTYVDVHKLLDSLFFVLVSVRLPISSKLVTLLNQFLPRQLRCLTRKLSVEAKRALKLHTVHLASPQDVLQHPYFAELTVPTHQPILKKYQPRTDVFHNRKLSAQK